MIDRPRTRLKLNVASARELRARYQTRAEAEIALASYLLGIALQLGLSLDDYEGFDDASNELILRDGASVPRRRR